MDKTEHTTLCSHGNVADDCPICEEAFFDLMKAVNPGELCEHDELVGDCRLCEIQEEEGKLKLAEIQMEQPDRLLVEVGVEEDEERISRELREADEDELFAQIDAIAYTPEDSVTTIGYTEEDIEDACMDAASEMSVKRVY